MERTIDGADFRGVVRDSDTFASPTMTEPLVLGVRVGRPVLMMGRECTSRPDSVSRKPTRNLYPVLEAVLRSVPAPVKTWRDRRYHVLDMRVGAAVDEVPWVP
jgi:hypothetical protein